MSGRHVPAGTTIFKLDAGGDLAAVMAAAPRYTVRHPFSLPANARSALGGAVFVFYSWGRRRAVETAALGLPADPGETLRAHRG